jgi:hypothetical protein
VRYLEKLNPSAAASLREGLEETLTVHKLEVAGLLRKTLQTFSPLVPLDRQPCSNDVYNAFAFESITQIEFVVTKVSLASMA